MTGQSGIHALVFGDSWTEATAKTTCRAAAEIGYGLVDVLMFDPDTLDLAATRAGLAGTGLGLRLGMALGPGTDISSVDAEVAANGEAAAGRVLEIAADLGAPAASGITCAAFGSYTAPQTAAQRARVVGSLQRRDPREGAPGVRLGLEPVNHNESYMVNTLDQAAAMIADAGGANLFIQMDTFHMNIEEGDIAAAIHRNAGLPGDAHVADSNRGMLGGGHFNLSGFFRALAAEGNGGNVTVESFTSKVLSADLVGGVRLWREAWTDAATAARTALAAMRAARAAAEAGVRV